MVDHKHLTTELTFDAQFQSPTVGQSEGIFLMWKDDLLKLEEVATNPQGVHDMVKNILEDLASMYEGSWLVGGDLNELLKARDQFGRYSNKQDLILERLDRCFETDAWIEKFPESTVTHLPRTHSDHCLLLLSFSHQNHNRANNPFKFESMWCSHPNFFPLEEDSFDARTDILEATSVFTNRETGWNKHAFGNIFHRKRHILARLSGIQKSNAYPFRTFLQDLEAKLQHDFSAILKSKEYFWKLKSIISLLIEGDANTKFFYISTLNKRRRNMIMSLKDEVGNNIQNP
ncbi:uncharacterized protein LOC142174468 [Nicotiana tabacum]|uniref:Uncharacterized protein LOC142174468 n=1 Tax=Nicotiana tabacum TaxID=4097 RepID=A0AC58TGM8_TOBAC